MAVKTDFTLEDIRTALADYAIGHIDSLSPMTHGNDQTNLAVSAGETSYVFRYYEKRPEEYVRYEIDLLDYLAKYDFPSPSPIFNKNGQAIGFYAGKPFVLFEFMAGEHRDNQESALLVAESIGRLHTLTKGYKPNYAEARAALSADYVLGFAAAKSGSLPASEATARTEWLKSELSAIHLPADMPKGAIHGDLNPGNFLYVGDSLSAVLDFDQSGYTFLIHDVAQLIYWWAWGNPTSIDWDLASRLVSSYQAHRVLSNDEKDHLYDMLLMVNLISMGWDFASDDFIESQSRVNYLKSVGRNECKVKLFTR